MIAQCIEERLAAGMGEVHIFIGKDGTILTRAKREKDERSSLPGRYWELRVETMDARNACYFAPGVSFHLKGWRARQGLKPQSPNRLG